MISLFEGSPWKNWKPISTSRLLPFAPRLPSSTQPAAAAAAPTTTNRNPFQTNRLTFTLFPRGLRPRGETAASGLEFTGNNTGARRATADELPSIRGAIRSLPASRRLRLSQLLNCQSQPEVSGACASSLPRPPRSRPRSHAHATRRVASRRFNPCSAALPTFASLPSRISHRNCWVRVALPSGISREFPRGRNESVLRAFRLRNAAAIPRRGMRRTNCNFLFHEVCASNSDDVSPDEFS